jgi:DNA-binding NarL/FixJ family response regulator
MPEPESGGAESIQAKLTDQDIRGLSKEQAKHLREALRHLELAQRLGRTSLETVKTVELLTESEILVVELISFGMNKGEVAKKMCLSDARTREVIESAEQKLGTKTPEQMVKVAYESGFLFVPETDDETLKMGLGRLTKKEFEVINKAVDGFDIDATAQELGNSSKTVKSHRNMIIAKLGAVNMANAIRLLCALGYYRSDHDNLPNFLRLQSKIEETQNVAKAILDI